MWRKIIRFFLYILMVGVSIPIAFVSFFLPLDYFLGKADGTEAFINYFSFRGIKSRLYAAFLIVSAPIALIKDLV